MSVAAPDAAPVMRADIVGISCGFDLLVASAPLPQLAEGDLLAFLDTGAYQDAGANNFNAMPRPATVLVHGAEAEVIKRAETVADVFARDVVPARMVAAGPAGERAAGAVTAAGVPDAAETLHHVGMVTPTSTARSPSTAGSSAWSPPTQAGRMTPFTPRCSASHAWASVGQNSISAAGTCSSSSNGKGGRARRPRAPR